MCPARVAVSAVLVVGAVKLVGEGFEVVGWTIIVVVGAFVVSGSTAFIVVEFAFAVVDGTSGVLVVGFEVVVAAILISSTSSSSSLRAITRMRQRRNAAIKAITMNTLQQSSDL